MRVRWAALATCALFATGCDPAFVPTDPEVAEISIGIDPSGSAETTVMLGGGLSEGSVAEVLVALPTMIVTSASATTARVEGNDDGYPYIVIRSRNAFRHGREATVTLEAEATCQALRRLGYRSITTSLQLPAVSSNNASTQSSPASPSACGIELPSTITLHPRQLLGWGGVALSLASCLIGVALWRRRLRHRVVRAVVGLVGMLIPVFVLFTGASQWSDNFQVAGHSMLSRCSTYLAVVSLGAAGWIAVQLEPLLHRSERTPGASPPLGP